ncbi:MAG: SDR family NAD(P)-dependent oxidoreductase [Methylococcaceae bacterium]|nr:SDR family NAD(P)-dependent oxidoreductase [Methylococcaceae bacterium]
MKNILITGVSSGIGAAIAEASINNGHTVFGTVRNETDAARCQRQWGNLFVPLIADIRDADAIKAIFNTVQRTLINEPLHILINNAGILKPAPLALQPITDIEEMLEVNVTSTIRVIQTFLPLIKTNAKKTPSKIINISSISGQIAAPFLGGYTASKFAMEGFSNSLRRELMPLGIQVVIIAPGSVRTPIWSKASNPNYFPGSLYEQPFKKFIASSLAEAEKGLQPTEIANLVADIINNKNPKIRYNPVPQKFANYYLPKLMSGKMLDRLLFKVLGMKMMGKNQ